MYTHIFEQDPEKDIPRRPLFKLPFSFAQKHLTTPTKSDFITSEEPTEAPYDFHKDLETDKLIKILEDQDCEMTEEEEVKTEVSNFIAEPCYGHDLISCSMCNNPFQENEYSCSPIFMCKCHFEQTEFHLNCLLRFSP